MKSDLELKLDAIEHLARGSKLARFLHHPLRYCQAIGYWRLVYPLSKKGKFALARTFFSVPMEVVLPSATEIFLFGAKTHDSEIRLTRFLLKNLHPGDVFTDVGAHFGFYTLLASQLTGETGRVLSVEASGSTFSVLKRNAASASNVTLLHRAATDVDKTLIFNEYPVLFSEYNSLISAGSAAWAKHNPPQKTEVQGVRLDDVFKEKNCLPTMVKIDAEGAELQVLQGMQRFLTQYSPTIIAEFLFAEQGAEGAPTAFSFLQKLGYSAFLILNDGALKPVSNMNSENTGLESDNFIFRKPQSGLPS